jgi:hypothetical protein
MVDRTSCCPGALVSQVSPSRLDVAHLLGPLSPVESSAYLEVLESLHCTYSTSGVTMPRTGQKKRG